MEPIKLDAWNLITYTFSKDNEAKLYVNGTCTNSFIYNSNHFNVKDDCLHDFRFKTRGDCFKLFDGYLDELKMHSRPLTQDEISTYYNYVNDAHKKKFGKNLGQ